MIYCQVLQTESSYMRYCPGTSRCGREGEGPSAAHFLSGESVRPRRGDLDQAQDGREGIANSVGSTITSAGLLPSVATAAHSYLAGQNDAAPGRAPLGSFPVQLVQIERGLHPGPSVS